MQKRFVKEKNKRVCMNKFVIDYKNDTITSYKSGHFSR